MRTEFENLLNTLNTSIKINLETTPEGATLISGYNTKCTETAKAKWPKKRIKTVEQAWRILAQYEIEEIKAVFKARINKLVNDKATFERGLKESLRIIAEKIEVRRGNNWLKYNWVYGGAYRSQGFGARRYAEQAAQQHVDKANFYSIEAEARSVGEYDDFDIYVQVESLLDVEILHYKPAIDLKEWIKLCWGRGVNPRVYDPFLPHGIEEKLGLDYFGKDAKQ